VRGAMVLADKCAGEAQRVGKIWRARMRVECDVEPWFSRTIMKTCRMGGIAS
jgi:hypothetical protein